jgi:hypothetical protein
MSLDAVCFGLREQNPALVVKGLRNRNLNKAVAEVAG